MTKAEIAEARAACEKATPGPWEVRYGTNFTDIGKEGFNAYCDEHHDSATPLKVAGVYWPWPGIEDVKNKAEENAAFIAIARTALPAALDKLAESEKAPDNQWKRMRAALARKDAEIAEYVTTIDKARLEAMKYAKEASELREENSCMARQLAEPSENQTLRAEIANRNKYAQNVELMWASAIDEISFLHAEVERLKKALERIARGECDRIPHPPSDIIAGCALGYLPGIGEVDDAAQSVVKDGRPVVRGRRMSKVVIATLVTCAVIVGACGLLAFIATFTALSWALFIGFLVVSGIVACWIRVYDEMRAEHPAKEKKGWE